jgi:hypothetical protein
VRRFVSLFLAAGLSLSLSGMAEARSSLKVRSDPNDSAHRMDVRRVVTDLSARTVFVRIDSWQRYRLQKTSGFYTVVLDSGGDPGFDRVIWIQYGRCEVSVFKDGELGRVVGTQRATRANRRSITCAVPRTWFPRINRAVRFRVYLVDDNRYRDLAPDRGLYIWL